MKTKKSLMSVLTSTIITATVLSGCCKTEENEANITLPPQSSLEITVTETSAEGKTPIEQIDPKTISPVNEGYIADMNYDRINDWAIMDGRILYFSAGRKDGSYNTKIPVLKVNGDIIGYRIDKVPGKIERPSLIYFDSKGKGYLQRNIGQDSYGNPSFAEVEILAEIEFEDF